MFECLNCVRYCSCQERKPKPDIFELTCHFLLITSTIQTLLVNHYFLRPRYREKKENQVQRTTRKSTLRLLIHFCKEFSPESCVIHLSDFMVQTLSNIKLSHILIISYFIVWINVVSSACCTILMRWNSVTWFVLFTTFKTSWLSMPFASFPWPKLSSYSHNSSKTIIYFTYFPAFIWHKIHLCLFIIKLRPVSDLSATDSIFSSFWP